MLRLRELRGEKGLTLIDVSSFLGLTPQVLSRYERGDREPDLNTLIMLANYYEVSIDYLLGRENEFGQIITNYDLSEDEKTLISRFRQLSDTRKETVLDSVSYMLDSEKFRSLKDKSIS